LQRLTVERTWRAADPVLVSQLLPAASGGFSFKAFEDIALAAILVIDLAVLALVIFVTTWASRWLAIPTEDEIAAVFCGSKKSMAGGIPMAAILFPGHAVGLIVLPLMLFHQAQLFVCASLARHYARRSPQSSRLAAAIA
jgi:sodium/bile acid cotransporter 7